MEFIFCVKGITEVMTSIIAIVESEPRILMGFLCWLVSIGHVEKNDGGEQPSNERR